MKYSTGALRPILLGLVGSAALMSPAIAQDAASFYKGKSITMTMGTGPGGSFHYLLPVKGMGNGSPIGCTIAPAEVADALQGSTFSTFGGNPVTMATALATVEYIEAHDLPTNCEVQGARMAEKLDEFAAEFPFIGEVRGAHRYYPPTKKPRNSEALEVLCAPKKGALT